MIASAGKPHFGARKTANRVYAACSGVIWARGIALPVVASHDVAEIRIPHGAHVIRHGNPMG
jgi:hypothetical protein